LITVGVGKTHIAHALGHLAVRAGADVFLPAVWSRRRWRRNAAESLVQRILDAFSSRTTCSPRDGHDS